MQGWGCGVPADWAAGQSARGLSTMVGRACEPLQVLSCRVVTEAASSCQAGDALVKGKSGHAFFCPEALVAPCCMQKKAQVLTATLEVLPCWPRCSPDLASNQSPRAHGLLETVCLQSSSLRYLRGPLTLPSSLRGRPSLTTPLPFPFLGLIITSRSAYHRPVHRLFYLLV